MSRLVLARCANCGRMLGYREESDRHKNVYCADKPCFLLPPPYAGNTGIKSALMVSLAESGIRPSEVARIFGVSPQAMSQTTKLVAKRWAAYQ